MTETWLQNGPVSEVGWWTIWDVQGYSLVRHGRWELNGGALTIFDDEGNISEAFGNGAWKKILPGAVS